MVNNGPQDTQYGVLDLGSSVLLVIRGTKEGKDWTTSNWRSFAGNPISRRSVSGLAEGFGTAADRNYDNMVSILRGVGASKSKPVWVMGHSLGGAVTLIVSTWLHKSGAEPFTQKREGVSP